MAWDTDRTRAGLLEAGVSEFSAHGLAGARVDRIAAAAGINKERIYQYFGNKEGLFDAVLESELSRLMEHATLAGRGPDAFAAYAGEVFDHHESRPELSRLLFWEGLERGPRVVAQSERIARCAAKTGAVERVLPGSGREAACELLLTVITLCAAWQAAPQLDAILQPGATARPAARRAAIVETARCLAQGAVPGPPARREAVAG